MHIYFTYIYLHEAKRIRRPEQLARASRRSFRNVSHSYVQIYKNIYLYICTYIFVYIYVCIHIYAYLNYKYIYTHIFHIHIFTSGKKTTMGLVGACYPKILSKCISIMDPSSLCPSWYDLSERALFNLKRALRMPKRPSYISTKESIETSFMRLSSLPPFLCIIDQKEPYLV